MDAGTWGFIGVFVGAASSIATTFLLARNARLLQQETSSIERTERAREFQRTNLLELQERLLKQTMLTLKYRTRSRRTEEFMTTAVSDEFIMSSQSLSFLTARIADQSLREMVERITHELNSTLMDDTGTDSADDAMAIIVKASNEAWVTIGVALRSNY